MGSEAVYLYCFARAGTTVGPDVVGVDGGPSVAGLEAGKVAAVFSRVRRDDFSADASAPSTQAPEWVVPRACRHQRVIEDVMRTGPVLPVRFGTVFSSEQALLAILSQRNEEIALILDRLSDKEEWAVKAFVDEAKAREWLLATDPALAEARRGGPGSPGARYLHEKRVQGEADKVLRRVRAAWAGEVQANCLAHGVAARPLRLQPKKVSGREGEMLLNLALLVKRGRGLLLQVHVQQLGAAYAEQGITLEVSGPWPPYNFCPPPEAGSDETSGVLHSA